jgi:two-component system NtrC family sensor kinase
MATSGAPIADRHQAWCKAAREYFAVETVSLWRIDPGHGFVCEAGVSTSGQPLRGRRLALEENAAAYEAVTKRRTVFETQSTGGENGIEAMARSVMVAPLVVSDEVSWVMAFLQSNGADFFNEEMAAKATILAGQLGCLIEANLLNEQSRNDHQRAAILVEIAQAVQTLPDADSVAEAVGQKIRNLLGVGLVTILLRRGQNTSVAAISAANAELREAAGQCYTGRSLEFATDLMARAVMAGEPIAISTHPTTQCMEDLVPPGVLLAAPLRTSQADGAILIYPRAQRTFTADEKSLISAIAGFASVAISNTELYGTAFAQAQELHQLLEILTQLSSTRKLDEFLQQFVVRAADFLGFRRSFVGLLDDGAFHVRWTCVDGKSQSAEVVLPEGPITRSLLTKETFYSENAIEVPGVDLKFLEEFHVRQLLAVPLVGSDSAVLGVIGLLDRMDKSPISRESVRSARTLAAQASIALQSARNLHVSRQSAERAELLMRLAIDLHSKLQLPEFGKMLLSRSGELMRATSGAVLVRQDSVLETISIRSIEVDGQEQSAVLKDFNEAITELVTHRLEPIICGNSEELLGKRLSSSLGWKDLTVVRLSGTGNELAGVLCLVNAEYGLKAEGKQLLQAISAYASTAMENSRLFTRMDQANRHWMDIFDAITDFIVAHDSRDNVLRVNRSLAEFIGVQPHELIGMNMGGLLASGEQTPGRTCPFCKPTAEEGTDEYVHPVLDRIYLVSSSQVHSASDEGLQTIHVLKDITDRREAERRYRELFDNIQEGVFFATPDGRFIEVNDALVRMLGYSSREELLQADIRSQICVAPNCYEEMAAEMQRRDTVRNHEQTLRKRDGSLIHVLVNAFALRDGQGRISQYRGVMLDISGLKSYQSELQRERDFSGKILNNTQNLILVADVVGVINYANRRWFEMGYQEGQLLGQRLEGLVAPGSQKALSDGLAQTLAGQQVDNLELHLIRGEGRVGHFSVNLSPMRDEHGNIASIVVVMSDITDAATLQAKLMHAEKLAAVGQLVSGVAHEVNNPLTAILGFADLLMENPEMPESGRKDLRVILQEAQRTKQIVQNLLSFARQMPPQRKPVQLNTILKRTLQLRSYDFHSRGVEVVEHLDETLPQIVGDSHQLQQVFLNIVNNAYDAVRDTGRPARILVTSVHAGNMVEIVFRDNGHGISFPDRIFDPFFTTKEIGKGTGLGLSICYGIVREHGGEIVCHNNGEEAGATFIVRLPVQDQIAALGATAGGQPQ